jgi:hypothetical protein
MRLLLSPAGTPEQAALVRSELLLTQRLKELSHELSDASLQQVGLLMRHCCSCISVVLVRAATYCLRMPGLPAIAVICFYNMLDLCSPVLIAVAKSMQ